MINFNDNKYYELAPSQIPEWYAHQLDSNSPVYNISFNHFFFKNINSQIFVDTWQKIINRHLIFRIRFSYHQDRPMQWLGLPIQLDKAEICIDKTGLPMDMVQKEQDRLAREYSILPFNFETGPLFRLYLIEYPEQEFQLIFTIHHIIWDETSTINLIKEFTEIYQALLEGQQPKLPDLQADYFNYTSWINECLSKGIFDKHKEYWLKIYKTVPPLLQLPEDFLRPAVQTYNGNTLISWLPRILVGKIQDYLYKNNLTLFIFLLSTLALYFYRLTGQDDFVLGCPMAGRDRADFQPLLGCFAVPVPIRCEINKGMTFIDLLQQIKQRVIEAFEHHQYPCNQLIEQLVHNHDLSRPKLFSVMSGVQNNKTELLKIKLGSGYLYTKNIYSAENHGARFDLAIGLDPLGSDIKFFCTYNTDLFRASTISRMLESIIYLTGAVLENPIKHLGEYSIIPEKLKKQIILNFNDTHRQLDLFFPLTAMFEKQVIAYPNRIALINGESIVSYAQLNSKSNQLANYLYQRGVRPQKIVAVILEPEIQLIVALLAILKLGACYVPISPAMPSGRAIDIIVDSQAEWVLSTNPLDKVFSGPELIFLDEVKLEIDKYSVILDVTAALTAQSLAYIIYTSGTTGVPKGIPINQGGVIHLLSATQEQYRLQESDNILFLSPFTFDASILEIFWPLSYGAHITIPDFKVFKDPKYIIDLIVDYHITVLQTVPTLLAALCEFKNQHPQIELPFLRLIICGGSTLTRALRDNVLSLFPGKLVNHYGPTEVTVDATYFDCVNDFLGKTVPIGRPIPNVKIFILDEYRQLVSIGVIGEIYIHSPGLTPGYLHDPQRNLQAFIDFQPMPDMPLLKLFKTGDMGYFDENGLIYFCGRQDSQLKINGNRIEIGDIENTLGRHELVKKVIVKPVKSDVNHETSKLIAFIELQGGINRFSVGSESYYQLTLAQRPELLAMMIGLHLQTWPKYFEGSPVIKEYWSRIIAEFPDYQFCLMSSDHKIAAAGNGIPLYWDGRPETVPSGWDAGITLAFQQLIEGIKPNTILGLTGVVDSRFQGRGLSALLVHAFRGLAKMHNLVQFLGPVRPVGMLEHGTHDFTGWSSMKDSKGESVDFWLKTHQRIGAKILGLAPESQLVKGDLKQWQEWTGQVWEKSGQYYENNLLQMIMVDVENDYAIYYDPSIWVGHYDLDKVTGVSFHLNQEVFRRYLLEHLPAYMVPHQYYMLTQMPLTESGKINEAALPYVQSGESKLVKMPKNKLQNDIMKLWQRILNITSLGVNDNFFLLGGQSLQVVQMLAEISQHYRINIPLKKFYVDATIEALAVHIESAIIQSEISLEKLPC